MALSAQQRVCVKCDDVEFTDVTGNYDAVTNPGGYGAPNPDFGDLTPYTAAFYAPGQNTPVYTLNLYEDPPAPDADGYYLYIIDKTLLGATEDTDITSGWWRVLVTLGSATKWIDFLAYNDIAKKVNACICSSNGAKIQLQLDLEAAKYMMCCYKQSLAQKLITQLYRDVADCCCGCT